MRLENILNNKTVTQTGIRLAQATPPRLGYALANAAAAAIAAARPAIYRTVQTNLRHIFGANSDAARLAAATRAVFANAARFNYEFFHAIDYSPDQLIQAVHIPADMVARIQENTAQGRGTLLLGTHMGNFNLGILGLSACGLKIQALSLANPNQGFVLLNRLRARGGMELTPITPQSLRQAIARLKRGGVVMTAFDRPIPEERHLVTFLGKPAYFAPGPARLAVMTQACVIMGSCYYEPAVGHVLDARQVEMVYTGDKQQDIAGNVARMAQVLEQYVRQRPEQWMMFYPFWPDTPPQQDTSSSPLATTL